MNSVKLDTTHYVLICSMGALAHGPKDLVLKEFQQWKDWQKSTGKSDEEVGLRIEEFDFQTHTVSVSGIIPREKPLIFYSPKDLYEVNPIRIEHDLWRNFDRMFPEAQGAWASDLTETDVETRILFNENYHELSTLWFGGKPFMICQHWLDDCFSRFITDTKVYWEVIHYLLEFGCDNPRDVVDPNEVMIELTCFGQMDIEDIKEVK